jgi:hypothetical protein
MGKETVDGIDRDFATAVIVESEPAFQLLFLLRSENRRSLPGDTSVEGKNIVVHRCDAWFLISLYQM